MNWLEIIVISLVTAIVTSGLITALLKKTLFNYLERRQMEAKRDIEFQSEKRETFLSSRFDAYPELSEISYRAKIVAEECLKYGDLPSHKVEKFGELVSDLTEKLFKYRLYVPPEVWNNLHETKHLCQDLFVWLDVLSRIDNSGDEDVRETTYASAKKASHALTEKTTELDRLLKSSIEKIAKVKT